MKPVPVRPERLDRLDAIEPRRILFDDGADGPLDLNPYPYSHERNPRTELHLRDYWSLVRKRLWLVALVALFITALTALYVMRQPDVYQAQGRVEIDLENANTLAFDQSGKPVTFNRDPTYFNTQLQILTSPALLRRVIETLNLDEDPEFVRPLKAQSGLSLKPLERLFRSGNNAQKQPRDAAADAEAIVQANPNATAAQRAEIAEATTLLPYVSMLQTRLATVPVEETRRESSETRLVDVKFTHPDPQIAAKVVNTLMIAFGRSNLERKTSTTEDTGKFLQDRIKDLQAQVRSGEDRLNKYARSKGILSIGSEGENTTNARLEGLNRQLLDAENERKTAEAAYRAAQAPGAAQALSEENRQQVAQLETKLAALQQRRAELSIRNTEKWAEVREVKEQIGVLEKQIRESKRSAVSTILANLATKYRQAVARENSLRQSFANQRGETLKQNEAAVNYRIIQQEVETNRNLLNDLLQRSRQTDIALAGTANNIHIIDYATTPTTPVGPKRLMSVVLALLFSLGVGAGLVLLLEYFDDSINTVRDAKRLLGAPILTVVPSTPKLRERALPLLINLLPRTTSGDTTKSLSTALTLKESRSPIVEAYRRLRTAIMLSSANGSYTSPRTLLVTSSLPSEGKTTTAVNAALSFAQTGAKVLLIDADLQNPQLHTIFDLENTTGLGTALLTKADEQDTLDIYVQYQASNLYLMPSGPVPYNTAELLGSEQMHRLVENLSNSFDYIIIDSPPIATFTDGLLLSTIVDGVVLVVGGGRTPRDVVQHTQEMLQDVGARVCGVVLNNIKIDGQYDSYYYRTS